MASHIIHVLARFADDEVGGPALEYSLVASLIAMVLLVGLLTMSQSVSNTFDHINIALEP